MRTTGLLVLVGLLALAGPALGEHFSVGASVSEANPEETSDHPSVGPELYDRGTELGCGQAAVDPDRPSRAFQDALCGELVYHEGTDLEVASPRDQDLRGQIGRFDVRRTHNAGTYELRTCRPWCLDGRLSAGAYDEVNRLAWWAGLSPSDYADEEDRGWQAYGANLQVPHALSAVQASTGVGTADGWKLAPVDHAFVATLEDREGNPIGERALRELIRYTDGLPSQARETICGYSADVHPREPSVPGCDLVFHWRGSQAETDNRCRSPTYVCGLASSAWHARLVCLPTTPTCQRGPASGPPVQPPGPVDRDPTTQAPTGTVAQMGEPAVWHFVVAPTPSTCGGHREPGFDPSPRIAELAYLAHDLDVHLPPDNYTGRERWAPLTAAVGQHGIATVGDASREGTHPAWRDHAREPDQEGSLGGAQDTSANRTIERTWSNCRLVREPTETRSKLDPWVNLVDARLERTRTDGHLEGSIEAPTDTEGERARTGTYTFAGRVVYAADTDDDGDYAEVPWQRQFQAPARAGVYPVFWDLRVGEDGYPDPEQGCAIHGGATSTQLTLTEAMLEAGYRTHTGVLQAVGLDEPVVWTHRPTGQRFVYPDGGVFLLASQAPHALGLGPSGDPIVYEHAAEIVRAAASAAGLEDRSAVVLRENLDVDDPAGPRSDFEAQCGEPAGGFTSAWTLTRTCADGSGCARSVSVTRLLVELADPVDGFHRGETWIEPFPTDHREAFPTGQHAWTDVDRLGSDP